MGVCQGVPVSYSREGGGRGGGGWGGGGGGNWTYNYQALQKGFEMLGNGDPGTPGVDRHRRTHGAPFCGHGHVPLGVWGNVVMRTGTQQQTVTDTYFSF